MIEKDDVKSGVAALMELAKAAERIRYSYTAVVNEAEATTKADEVLLYTFCSAFPEPIEDSRALRAALCKWSKAISFEGAESSDEKIDLGEAQAARLGITRQSLGRYRRFDALASAAVLVASLVGILAGLLVFARLMAWAEKPAAPLHDFLKSGWGLLLGFGLYCVLPSACALATTLSALLIKKRSKAWYLAKLRRLGGL